MNEETKDPQEETAQEAQQAAPMEPPEETVGDMMKKAPSEAVKHWVIVFSVLVYLAGIVYAETHGINALSNGTPPHLRIWALVGMIAAGVSAVLLPLALKVWTIEAKQRIAAYGFYLLDFAFLVFNSFVDFSQVSGAQLAPWAVTYYSYVLPASPVLVAIGWAILWELDPSVKQKVLQLSLRAAMREKMARKVADAAKGANVTATVNAAAEHEVERALTELFGTPAKRADNYYVIEQDRRPGWGELARGFFGSLLERALSGNTTDTRTQSAPSDSNEPQP
jgi:hypothetical protein